MSYFQDEHLRKFFEKEKAQIADQLIAQQPVAPAARTKILGIHPPKIPDEHAGLINGDIVAIEAEAKEQGWFHTYLKPSYCNL